MHLASTDVIDSLGGSCEKRVFLGLHLAVSCWVSGRFRAFFDGFPGVELGLASGAQSEEGNCVGPPSASNFSLLSRPPDLPASRMGRMGQRDHPRELVGQAIPTSPMESSAQSPSKTRVRAGSHR